MRLGRRGTAVGVLALAALLAPASTPAHDPSGFALQAAVLTTAAPTLDGVMQPGEWASATTTTFDGNVDNGQFWIMHDGTDVYVAFRRLEPAPGTTNRFQLYFDNGHNGALTTGDDSWSLGVTVPGGSVEVVDSYYNGAFGNPPDSVDGGTTDTNGSATYTAGAFVAEFKHPRCTADISHDVCIPINGAPVGVTFYFIRDSNQGTAVFRPAAFDDQANFGHLTLAPLAAPETTIDSGPSDYEQTASANFAFSSNDAGATFQCSLDGAAFTACTSPAPYSSLAEGPHVFEVQAVSGTDVDPTPARWRWTVDTVGSTGTLDQHNGRVLTTTGGRSIGGPDNPRLAQIFTPGSGGQLADASVGLRCTTPQTIEASIRATTGGPPDDAQILATDTATVGAGTAFTRFQFSPAPALAAGTAYALVLTGSAAGSCYAFMAEDAYPGLVYWDDDSANTPSGWTVNEAPEDIGFATFMLAAAPDPGVIAFVSTRDGNPEIYLLDVATGGVTRLTNNPATDVQPSISGDGTKITWTSDRAGPDFDIFRANIDGTGVVQLTSNTTPDGDPSYAPDSSRIAYISTGVGGNGDVTVMNDDGSGNVQLTATAANERFTSWSPDSATILYEAVAAGGVPDLFTIPAAGGTATNLTNTPGSTEEEPNFSNDGSMIVFVESLTSIWRMNADGSGRVQVANGRSPDFSPDGSQIVFDNNPTGGNRELFTVNLDGSGLTNITNTAGTDQDADWGVVPAAPGPLVVTNANDSGAGSLRAAIDYANTTPGHDTITFAIPGEGIRQISLASALPSITEAATIDGRTQSGWFGPPVIRVDGTGLPLGSDGFTLTGGGSTIRGLMLTNMPDRGIDVLSSGNTIVGNYLGTDGLSAFAGQTGISVRGSSNVVGGATAVDRNVVVGTSRVVEVQPFCIEGPCGPAAGNVLRGNYLGTNAAGNAALGQPFVGVYLAGVQDTVIGGPGAGQGNVIGGAGFDGGIYVESATGTTTIQGNLIGVAANGIGQLPNRGPGIQIEAGGLLVGGTTAGAGNVIAYNGEESVDTGVVVASGTGSSILGNSIHDNIGLGIALAEGANNDQDAPRLDEVSFDDGVTVRGRLDSLSDTTFRIEFFSSAACDESGYGEGATFLGFENVTTNDVGNASFTVTVPAPPGGEGVITATATDPDGNTSEFSECIDGGTPSRIVTLTSDEQTIPVGAKLVPLSSVPSNQLPSFAGSPSSAPVGSIPVGSIPVGSIPVGSIPVGSIPVGSIPVGSIPVGSIPVGSIPVGSIGLSGIPVGSIGLNQILLSMLPVDADALLAGTDLASRPRQAITLADVYANATTRTRFEALTLAQSGLSQSILAGVPFSAFLLGGATLDQLPPPDAASWCDAITAAGGSCSGVDTSTNTVLGLSIASVPVGSIPVGSIPVGSIPVGSIPVGSIPVGSIDLEASRLAGIPVGSISEPALVVNCGTACPAGWTLRDAKAANAILASAELRHLVGAFPADLVLNDLILGIVPRSSLSWEGFPIDGFQLFAGTGDAVRYRVRFGLPCPVPGGLSVSVRLAAGWLYKPGSTRWQYGTAEPVPGADPTTSADTGASWTQLPGNPCAGESRTVELSFQALSGFSLGSSETTASVTMSGVTRPAIGHAPVLVTQNWEDNDSAADAPVIGKDGLVIGHVASSGDKEIFRIPVPTIRGTRTTVYLSHIAEGADFDLVIGKPATASLQSNPVGSIPVGSIPVEDGGSSVSNSGEAVPPETLQDIPVGSIPVGSISANRGNADEAALVVAEGETGFYTIVVSGYNGSYSDQPFVLRVVQTPPPTLPPCPARNLRLGQAGSLPASLPAATKTLFLVNKQRMAAMYGTSATNAMLSAAGAVAARAEVAGQVLQVDGNAAVRNAYAAWDANPCSIDTANGVVAAVNAVVAGYRVSLPNLKYVVVLGSDESIPMMRRLDPVTISNETDEAADLLFTTTTAQGPRANALYAAAALGYFLSDTVYGAFTGVPWLGRDLYLPNVAVGRLVETPVEIQRQLELYVAAGGQLAPTKTLATGYDFLTDGAEAVAAALTGIGSAHNTLISDSWNATELSDAFTSKSPPDDVLSVNAHYSHWLLQPAAGPALVSTGDLPPLPSGSVEPAFARRILFTMGCHAGLNVANTLVPAPTAFQAARLQDWAQSLGQQRSAVYVANTGFGYGDTEANALSERLMSIFAERLATGGVIGDRWVDAVHEYFGTAGVYGVYDEKALSEATFYGLPFWRVGSDPAAPPTPAPPTFDATLGFSVASEMRNLSPTENSTSRGSFWDLNGNTLAIHYRPIQPRVAIDVTKPNFVATGAMIMALETQDIAGVDPVNATPTIDLAANELERNFQPLVFPASPVALTRSRSYAGNRQHAVVIAGQFRPGGGTDLGTERLVRSINLQVAYVPSPTDSTPPLVEQVSVVNTASATIFVRASDDAAGGVKRVAALWTDGTPSGNGTLVWNFQPLTFDSALGGWKATVPTSGQIQVIAMAQNTNGLVGYSANKGVNFPSVTDTEPPEILVQAPAAGARYALQQRVPVSFACSDAGVVTSCTGEPILPSGLLDTDQLGPHVFTITTTDLSGQTRTLEIPYEVVRWNFSGFLPPIENPPAFNTVRAGSTVSIKFSLGVNAGLDIIEGGRPSSRDINCTTGAGNGGPVIVPPGSSDLTYDARTGEYQLGWQTEAGWAGTCRELIVRFKDGTEATARFTFKKK